MKNREKDPLASTVLGGGITVPWGCLSTIVWLLTVIALVAAMYFKMSEWMVALIAVVGLLVESHVSGKETAPIIGLVDRLIRAIWGKKYQPELPLTEEEDEAV